MTGLGHGFSYLKAYHILCKRNVFALDYGTVGPRCHAHASSPRPSKRRSTAHQRSPPWNGRSTSPSPRQSAPSRTHSRRRSTASLPCGPGAGTTPGPRLRPLDPHRNPDRQGVVRRFEHAQGAGDLVVTDRRAAEVGIECAVLEWVLRGCARGPAHLPHREPARSSEPDQGGHYVTDRATCHLGGCPGGWLSPGDRSPLSSGSGPGLRLPSPGRG